MAVALVTGGTSGIGAEFARQLAERGWDIVLVARDVTRLDETARTLRRLGRDVEVLPADLADRADVDRVAARLEDPDRPVDLLVNNAGFGMHTPLTDPDVAIHDRAFEVMVRAVLVLSGAAARAMRERGRGRIVNVSSTAGFMAMGGYSAIKAWVTSYSEGLAVELRGTGVGVTALLPGWVRTEFHQRAGIRASSIPNGLWLSAERLVRDALRDVDRDKVISIPTVRYQVLIWLVRHAPKTAVRRVSAAISSSRRKPAGS
ncbi:SDR family NAD(P)-dependent oxidoreductase [Frigoribacterium sp. 2-23]|uniref:SDR family NAD(P)-dependent oxidoreductase n=1 Tax=Frigoribacterium sp. 2-23 TaxID=3415006 RepID=UPI003C6F2179